MILRSAAVSTPIALMFFPFPWKLSPVDRSTELHRLSSVRNNRPSVLLNFGTFMMGAEHRRDWVDSSYKGI